MGERGREVGEKGREVEVREEGSGECLPPLSTPSTLVYANHKLQQCFNIFNICLLVVIRFMHTFLYAIIVNLSSYANISAASDTLLSVNRRLQQANLLFTPGYLFEVVFVKFVCIWRTSVFFQF